MLNPTHKWCVYRSTHPLGFYYIGKGQTALVLAGKYIGSGTCLYGATELHADKYSKETWTATVLQTFPSRIVNGRDIGEDAAYAREKELVTIHTISDPFCMNDTLGGRSFRPIRLTKARIIAEVRRLSGKPKPKKRKRK